MIAMDAQGAEVAKPWVEKANASYRALLDHHNDLGKQLNLKYVPAGLVLDESGRLARPLAHMNIDNEDFRRELESWAETGKIPSGWIKAEQPPAMEEMTPDEQEANSRFELAITLLERDKKDEAIAELKRAFRLDPENWLIRKQLWALEHPERFYDGDVDFAWQKEQLAREDAEL